MGKKKKKKTRFNTFKVILNFILVVFLIFTALATGISMAIIKTAPPLDVNAVLSLNEPSILYDNKDNFMDKVVTDQQRTVIKFDEMPEDLKNAFISIEDERFYNHKGIDLKRISGATLINLKNKITKKSGLQGASTITQQLIKNTILTSEVSFKRKIQEIYIALKLEKLLSKEQILGSYMNTIYLGGSAYGVESAAKQYFNKSAKDLDLIQCAFIAGIPQSPSIYYPFSKASKENPSRYLNRTKLVLFKMYENGYISKSQYNDSIMNLKQNNISFNPPPDSSNKLNNEWFTLPTIRQVKKDLKSKYNYTDKEAEHLLMYGGLKIFTTMDKEMQNSTQEILNNSLGNNIDRNNIIQPQASCVIMDYHTGAVKVIIGGRGSQPPRSYNRAASNSFLRPPGSSIKPLTVYGPAIDSKKSTAATSMKDAPLSRDLSELYASNGVPYNPKNSPNIYRGDVTLRTAITHSINVISVKLEHNIGLNVGASYGEKFGLVLDSQDKSSIAALSLGQLHSGTNPLIMSAAYGVFGNNGNYTEPKLYSKVVDRDGNIVLENKHLSKKVLSPQSAYIMYDLLKGPVSSQGTGAKANFSSMARGKTGTSSDMKDLWFCGLTPYYSAAVWIGNDDNTICSGISSGTAAGIWGNIMESAHKNLPYKEIPEPTGISRVFVCADSGKLPNGNCSNIYTELFIEGTEPGEYCTVPNSYNKFKNKNIKDNNIKDKDKDKHKDNHKNNLDIDNNLDSPKDNNINENNNTDNNIIKKSNNTETNLNTESPKTNK
ncbi:transglycosylase domain-containing protein [Clostridium acetireducens]|nr:PBP1A family penicillin-binding protein [Clostridium acetireducens]